MGLPKGQQTTSANDHLRLLTPSSMSEDEVKQFVAAKVAEIRDCSNAEIKEQIAAGGGNMALRSPECVAAIAALERALGRKLVGAKDLKKNELTALDTVSKLIVRQLQNPNAGKRSR